MEVSYKEFTEKLGKLQRNETQMSERQKVVYAEQLKALKKKIAFMASEIGKSFILAGIRITKDEVDGLTKAVQAIIDQEVAKGTVKRASKTLFMTFDPDKFLEALIPIHNRVWYEGYAPYWCRHCKPYAGTSSLGNPLTFWNDLIGMGWDEKYKLWESEDEISWTTMMPPTMEQIKAEYEKERIRNG